LSYSDTSKNGLIETTEIVDESHYYPFGLKHSGYVTAVPDPNYKYKYNGKEFQDELGLNVYDYGFRNYMPDIGRWGCIDGMAEKYVSNSPYHYANNNPVLNYDVDGNFFVDIFSRNTAREFQANSRQTIQQNNSSISDMQNMVANGNLSEDALNNINTLIQTLQNNNSELQSSISEVDVLDSSNQGYRIVDGGMDATSGQTVYNSGVVDINAPIGNGYGLLGHEIHHAYQFETGATSLSFAGVNGIPLHQLIGVDLGDEWSAYRRQNAIEPNTSPYNSYNELNNDSTGPYSRHPRDPRSVSEHAQIQQILHSNGSEADKSRWLNNLSSRNNQAFRINGTTYGGNN
jgi:RHS repeat-associated protein